MTIKNPELIASVVAEYRSGQSIIKIEEEYDVNRGTVLSWLRSEGVKRRDNSDYKRYELDETIFEEIDNETAYWIGFLMADGNVYYDRSGSAEVSLALASKDRGHVKKFKKFVSTNKPIENIEKPKSNQSRLKINSKKLANDLCRYNVKPNKSFTATPHTNLEDNRHFWRGMVDGDGCISTAGNQPYLCLVGSENVIDKFENVCKNISNTSATVLKTQDGIYKFTMAGTNKASTISKYLYKDCSIYLDRKYKKAMKVIKQE